MNVQWLFLGSQTSNMCKVKKQFYLLEITGGNRDKEPLNILTKDITSDSIIVNVN